MQWDGWTLDRIVILFVSFAFLLIGIQVTLFHYRQNFRVKVMWTPVIGSPVFFVSGLLLFFSHADALAVIFTLLMWAGVLVGLIGFYMHFKGVGARVGGYKLRNFLIGPPVILPLLFCAVSVLGLIGIYWKGVL